MTLEETWKDIKGYEGLYQVSNFGMVKSLNYNGTKEEKLLKNKVESSGYIRLCLMKNGKRKSVLLHRLVAEAFLENPENKKEVNHKDGNKENNNVDNLEWVTPSENILHRFRVLKQQNKTKSVICIEMNKKYKSIIEASRETKVARQNIGKCCRGEIKTAGGYSWRYSS